MSTHNLCFEQKHEKYQNFLSEHFHLLVVKFSVYLNRHVFVRFVYCNCVIVYVSYFNFPASGTAVFRRHGLFCATPFICVDVHNL